MTQNCIVASAPGKVLVAGGYLVLEQAFTGLVVGTSSRFYTVIKPDNVPNTITVLSPQFDDATWKYNVLANNNDLEFNSITTESRNKFVETCLKFTLQIILERIGSESLSNLLSQGIQITIVGDNDFYSQRAQLENKQLENTVESLSLLEPFCKTHATLSTVHKTGLGSSAALTTSLVSALLVYFQVVSNELNQQEKTLIHNVAQFVHCFAQGKVGSGFDVSSAVWGSHRYKRFNPAILTPIMDENVDSKVLNETVDASNKSWDNEVDPFKLPPGFELMLADIDAGSHTPTLVSKVLAWKKNKPEEANTLWKELGSYNLQVEQRLRELNKLYEQDQDIYNQSVERFAQLKSVDWEATNNVEKEIVDLVQDFNQVRALLQKMSDLSDVPIEPKEQTRLLDECAQVPGVVMAGVPGAGGYDAIFCIALSKESKQKVHKVWESWKELSVGPLLSKSDSNGVTVVQLESIPGLSKVLS